jgi:hypothetical protein
VRQLEAREEIGTRAPRKPRRAKPAPEETQQPQASDLDAAVEALVKRYGCGSVIDAARDASHRLFKPGQKRA